MRRPKPTTPYSRRPERRKAGSIGACKLTGKTMYTSAMHAQFAANAVTRHQGGALMMAYQCNACGNHHYGHPHSHETVSQSDFDAILLANGI